MVIRKIIHLVPLVILILAVGYSMYVISTTSIVFGNKHYLGFVFLFGSIVGAFIRKDIGIYLTGVTLLIGTLNFIAFTPAIEAYSFGFGINGNGVNFKIQSFSFLVLVVYLLLNIRYLISQSRRKLGKDNNNNATH
jgi:hypothetical protein